MASNWIPQTEVVVGDDDTQLIGLTKPKIVKKMITVTENTWLDGYTFSPAVTVAYKIHSGFKALTTLGVFSASVGSDLPTTFTQSFTKELVLSDKTVDFIDLRILAYDYNQYSQLNVTQRLLQAMSNAGVSGNVSIDISQIEHLITIKPSVTLSSIQYEDAGNQRTYTISGTVIYRLSQTAWAKYSTSHDRFYTEGTGDRVGSFTQDVYFNKTNYGSYTFNLLIPNSTLAILNSKNIRRGIVDPAPTITTKSYLSSFLKRVFSRK